MVCRLQVTEIITTRDILGRLLGRKIGTNVSFIHLALLVHHFKLYKYCDSFWLSLRVYAARSKSGTSNATFVDSRTPIKTCLVKLK